ncbi:hypothetical protein [Paenibacillus paridis]|uniref:hypothetical protein n=1 Tax=Paenibacillus paridis TaxID=2583376 RepID=UPI00111E89C2|nr:hypothetical protein [Paenibacillus paridis]
MIRFILLFSLAFAGVIVFFIHRKKTIKDVIVFVVLSLFSLIIWIDIMKEHHFNPNLWISWMFDWVGF